MPVIDIHPFPNVFLYRLCRRLDERVDVIQAYDSHTWQTDEYISRFGSL